MVGKAHSAIVSLSPNSFPKNSLGSLSICSWYTYETERVGVLANAFSAHPEVLCCAVLGPTGNIVGKIERDHLFGTLGMAYGRDVFGKRPIRELMQPSRVFDPHLSAIEVSDELLEELRQHRHQYFVLWNSKKGYCGLVSSSDILLFLRKTLDERSRELEAVNRKLEKLSSTDGLTGIANRRSFDTLFASEWKRAQRSGQPLGLALIDVDYFKKYNDRYGHQAGDHCLKTVAGALASSFRRSGDLVARYGGEEFVLLSPETDSLTMVKLAEKIRLVVRNKNLLHEDSPLNYLTISVGVASFQPGLQEAPEALIKAADDALYRAKDRGRNRVESAPSA